jgi:hypothetical protein
VRVGEFLYLESAGWLARLRAQPRAPDKPAIVRLALHFANTGELRDWLTVSSIAKGHGVEIPLSSDRRLLDTDDQHRFREALTAIFEARETKPQKRQWNEAADDVLEIKVRHGEIQYLEVYTHAPMSGMLAKVLAWLIDEDEPELRKRLVLCHYSKCRAFSLREPQRGSGKPRTRYCDVAITASEDHMKLADNERKRTREPEPRRARRHK